MHQFRLSTLLTLVTLIAINLAVARSQTAWAVATIPVTLAAVGITVSRRAGKTPLRSAIWGIRTASIGLALISSSFVLYSAFATSRVENHILLYVVIKVATVAALGGLGGFLAGCLVTIVYFFMRLMRAIIVDRYDRYYIE